MYGHITDLVAGSVSHDGSPVLLSARAAELPGLADHLAQKTSLEIIDLPQAAASVGALRFANRISSPGSSLPLITRLNVDSTDSRPSISNRRIPTHVVAGGVAYELGTSPLWIGSAPAAGGSGVTIGDPADGVAGRHCLIRREDDSVTVEDLSGGHCTLNGRDLTKPTTLQAGDRLRMGSPGVVVELVAMVS
jgi:hypothetical protein